MLSLIQYKTPNRSNFTVQTIETPISYKVKLNVIDVMTW